MLSRSRKGNQSHFLYNPALNYYDMGWSLFPIIGKAPIWKWTPLQKVRATRERIQQGFSNPKVTGIAVIFGKVSGGLACRDFDTEEGYYAWKEKNPLLAKEIPTAKTRRGFHIYFYGPSGYMEYNEEEGLGEYRGKSGQYCLLPPSLHEEGGSYKWIIEISRKNLKVLDPEIVGFPRKSKEISKIINISIGLGPDNTDISRHYLEEDILNPSKYYRSNASHSLKRSVIVKIVEKYIPTGTGQRHNILFRLAQEIKGVDDRFATTVLRDVFDVWWKRSVNIVATKDKDYSFGKFIEFYDNCRFPGGVNWDKIKMQYEDELLPVEALCYTPLYQKLVKVCVVMQRAMRHRPFFLSCQKAGELIGSGSETARTGFRTMIRDGLLELVNKGSQVSGKASEYRYLPLWKKRSDFEDIT